MMKYFRSYRGTRSIFYKTDFLRIYSLNELKNLDPLHFKIFLN